MKSKNYFLAQDSCKVFVLYSYLDDPMPGGRQTHDAALVALCLVLPTAQPLIHLHLTMLDTLTILCLIHLHLTMLDTLTTYNAGYTYILQC